MFVTKLSKVEVGHARRESRLRGRLSRRGFAMQRCRARNPQVPGFGLYRISDPYRNAVVAGGHSLDFSLNLDDVEAFLADG